MTRLHELLRNEMVAAQLRPKEYYDLRRKPDPNLQSRDMVCLLPHNIKTTGPSKKLDYKKIGPFRILAKIGTSSYKPALPPSMAIHNTFHISLLEPYQDNRFPSQIKEPPPRIQIEGEDEYELDAIIDSRLHYNKLQYRAKWEGYSPEHDKVWWSSLRDGAGRVFSEWPRPHSGSALQFCLFSPLRPLWGPARVPGRGG